MRDPAAEYHHTEHTEKKRGDKRERVLDPPPRVNPRVESQRQAERRLSIPDLHSYSTAAEKPSDRSCWLNAAVSAPVTLLNFARASASFAASSLFTAIC